MGRPCGYFLGTSFSKICNFNREFKAKSFRGRISIIYRSSVAAIYQNKPLSPVSFFNCRNGLLGRYAHFERFYEVSKKENFPVERQPLLLQYLDNEIGKWT